MDGGGYGRAWREEMDECGLGSVWMNLDWDRVDGGGLGKERREEVDKC